MLKKLFNMKSSFEIDNTKANAFYSLTFGTDGQLCAGFGWGADKVNIKATT